MSGVVTPLVYHCPTCHSVGFNPSVIPNACTFCDGTEGGNPPVYNSVTKLWERA